MIGGIRAAEVCGFQVHRVSLVTAVRSDTGYLSSVIYNLILGQIDTLGNDYVKPFNCLFLAVIDRAAGMALDLDRDRITRPDGAVHMPLTAGILEHVPVDILCCGVVVREFCLNRCIAGNVLLHQVVCDLVDHISACC